MGEAVFVTDKPFGTVAVTVAVPGGETTGTPANEPRATAVLVTEPASKSACVIV